MTNEFDKGIADDQLIKEAELSADIQSARTSQGDAHMQLQVNRASEVGDIESLTVEQRTQMFNPDGTLPDHEVQRRMQVYVQEHSKVAFAPGEERRQVAGVGMDAQTQKYRMPSAGERVNQGGYIEMVDPRYADQVAERMKSVQEVDVKNTLQRSAAMNQLVMQVMNRVPDPVGAVHVTFDEARAFVAQFEAERQAGYPRWKHDFIPLREYLNHIGPRQRADGTFTAPFRDVLVNEHGVFQMGSNPTSRLKGKIVCVRDKDMTQNLNIQATVPSSNQAWLNSRAVAPTPMVSTIPAQLPAVPIPQAPIPVQHHVVPSAQPGPSNPVIVPNQAVPLRPRHPEPEDLLANLPPKPRGF